MSRAQNQDGEKQLLKQLDAPLLFVKRHSYTGIHIYDTFYKWPPGGGGIYVVENPSAPRAEWKIRAVIDPTTPETLGVGVYSHPELSWDAKKLLFCFKGEPTGSTSIYEIGVDGKGLRRLTNPMPYCKDYKGSGAGQHDTAPAYLPDGRIVFLSTRPSGLVPCNNTGVAILHVMNADGSEVHPISVNNVNEFDPAVLPDGRILFGRWEYVDKNALTIQSLWTIHPDGSEETALFANNMVLPEAILDARPVPNSHLIVGTLAKHNAPPRGSIAFIDSQLGKNNPKSITNLEHPNNPTFDVGDSCEPWAISKDVMLFSGRPKGHKRNAIEMMDRAGHRVVLLSDPDICLHSPMLIKPRPRPPVLPSTVDRKMKTGRFFVQDIYKGLTGVKRGEVKWLRVIEETSRVSPSPGSPNPYNQTFLLSAALAFSVKNFLGVVPVDENGSAYFEVPAGRAVYFQALDAEGRLIQSMRTFVQAAPGATRSCIGCHETKSSTPSTINHQPSTIASSLRRPPSRLQPESWGSGFVDYPGMVQPVFDKHCVSCHGGAKGIAAGLDLSGGWTEHFNISYENLVSRRETQLVAYWISAIDCMNGTAFWSAQLFPPRSHGSGAAPLAQVFVSGHKGYIPNLTRRERDLLMAWIDTNGLYYGTWDYTKDGYTLKNWNGAKQALIAEMQSAGCMKCHGEGNRIQFENDWINLKDPEFSRILRAPLAPSHPLAKGNGIKSSTIGSASRRDASAQADAPGGAAFGVGKDGFGLGLCRDRKANPQQQRVRLLWNGYLHAVTPIENFARRPVVRVSAEGESFVSFASTDDPHYQKMLNVIRRAREDALAAPRVDMPGAEVIAGACRQFAPPPLPKVSPPLQATLSEDGVVHLAWERSAQTIGLEMELHRSSKANFTPDEKTLLTHTSLFNFTDTSPPVGKSFYALVLISGEERSQPIYTNVSVPPPSPPPAPTNLKAASASCSVRLQWQAPQISKSMGQWVHGFMGLGYHVYRSVGAKQIASPLQRITEQPVRQTSYTDSSAEVGVPYTYVVRAVSQRGVESEPTAPVTASAIVIKEPVFVASFAQDVQQGKVHGNAKRSDGSLDLRQGGYVTFPHQSEFDLSQPISVECWVYFEKQGHMPVIVSCGVWQQSGWFLQWLGNHWRWHVSGIDCDGGAPALGRWIHLVGTFDGKTARLFQDGALVAEKTGTANTNVFAGELHVGQYSGSPSAEYQVTGRIAGVKIYHRPLDATEAAAAAKTKPQ